MSVRPGVLLPLPLLKHRDVDSIFGRAEGDDGLRQQRAELEVTWSAWFEGDRLPVPLAGSESRGLPEWDPFLGESNLIKKWKK